MSGRILFYGLRYHAHSVAGVYCVLYIECVYVIGNSGNMFHFNGE